MYMCVCICIEESSHIYRAIILSILGNHFDIATVNEHDGGP